MVDMTLRYKFLMILKFKYRQEYQYLALRHFVSKLFRLENFICRGYYVWEL